MTIVRSSLRPIRRWVGSLLMLMISAPDAGAAGPQPTAAVEAAEAPGPRHVYPRLMDPREHPDFQRRSVKPPTWDLLGHQTRFTILRSFEVSEGRLVNVEAEIDRFTRVHALGDVIWPSYPVLFATNLHELAEVINRRGLFLFDIWGYVPGSGPGGYWQQFQVPRSALDLLERRLGPRWLGMDIGEQDGRYVGGYAPQMHPVSTNRSDQYRQFHRHFDAMSEELGDRLCTLVSLNFGHYLVREGTHSLLGAETAQALPNSQVYYAFIRGAGKQYGVPWFGNASVYNRWGYKAYDALGDFADTSPPDRFGPTQGTSLSLLKRLLYSHILYNSMFAGFEQSWFQGDQLSPVGRIQQAAQAWVRTHGSPGVLHTPVALLLDFQAGWTIPRHLYTDRLYRVWGNLPYGPGDHLTDGVLDLLYPGYVDSSFFHDESGFLAPTPFGDLADCLLSDAPLWLLQQYPVVIAAGDLSVGREVRDRLRAYVEGGGHLVLTAGNLAKFPAGLAGVRVGPEEPRLQSGDVQVGSRVVREERGFELYPLRFPPDARWLACVTSSTGGRIPVAVAVHSGKGRLTILASLFGLPAQAAVDRPLRSEIDQPLPNPFPLLAHVRAVLTEVLRAEMLFEAGDGSLGWITCRKGTGEYTLGVFNNGWEHQPFRLRSHVGPILSIRELPLDASEKTAPGYLPDGWAAPRLGRSTEDGIAGGDVRIFAVRVQETGVVELTPRPPPAAPKGRVLALRDVDSIEDAILTRPTFFQHFDGVCVDWEYLHRRERSALQREARWLRLQKVRIVVDLTSGLNLYPDLRWVDNAPDEQVHSRSVMLGVLDKMVALGARELIVSLHRFPENNYTPQQTEASFLESLAWLSAQAQGRRVAVHLRLGPGRPPWNLDQALQTLDQVAAPNLKLAASPAWLESTGARPGPSLRVLSDRVGLWLLGGVARDAATTVWTVNAPPSEPDLERFAGWLRGVPAAPVVFDAVFPGPDDEYAAAVGLERLQDAPR